MRILFIRHGESEGNVDETLYSKVGDHKISLTDLGWLQALKAGQFLHDYYENDQTENWPRIFVSSYLRPKQTLSGVLHGIGTALFEGKPPLHEEISLIEKFSGARAEFVAGKHPLGWLKTRAMRALNRAVYKRDPFPTRSFLGDSDKDTYMATRSFLHDTLRAYTDRGEDDFVAVCHGAVMREAIREICGLPMDAKIPIPNNATVIEAIGEPGNWQSMRIIYDGKEMKAVDLSPAPGIQSYGYDDLPPVPDGLG